MWGDVGGGKGGRDKWRKRELIIIEVISHLFHTVCTLSLPLMWAGGVKWENFGPGSHLISFYLFAVSACKAFNLRGLGGGVGWGWGSRLSLSFRENELSWKLHYPLCFVWAYFSLSTISVQRPFGETQWSATILISKCLAVLHSIISRTISVWWFGLGFVSLCQSGCTRNILMEVLNTAFSMTAVILTWDPGIVQVMSCHFSLWDMMPQNLCLTLVLS